MPAISYQVSSYQFPATSFQLSDDS